MKLTNINLTDFNTKELVATWNAYQRSTEGKEIKKFADRKTAEKRVTKLLESLTAESLVQNITAEAGVAASTCEKLLAFIPQPAKKEKVEREDGKYNRTNPVFESEAEKEQYVSTQYATKTDCFPGKKSQFAGCTLELTKEINCPFREGTVVENSFMIIAENPGISYEDFRISGGRNTDLKAMVDKKIVKAKKIKRKMAA